MPCNPSGGDCLILQRVSSIRNDFALQALKAFDIFARTVPESALCEVGELQDVVDSIVLHTDGKGTKTALNAWLESLLAIAPSAAGFLIAQANAEQAYAAGWLMAAALRLVASVFVVQADARLLEHLLLTIPMRESTGSVERDDVEDRFSPIRCLASDDLNAATSFFRVAYAVLCDDARGKLGLRTLARDFVGAVGVTEMPALLADDENEEPTQTLFEVGAPNTSPVPPPLVEEVIPPLGTTMVDLYRAIRTVGRRESYSSPRTRIWSDLVRVLSDRINEMLLQRRENEVRRLLLFFARDAGIQSFSADPHPLAMLADALLERGHRRYAAMAFALAYTSTRGDWGEPFGGRKHQSLITRAIELDVDAVRELYLEQLVVSMKENQWPVDLSADILRRLSEWADAPAVKAAWHEMFGIISDRVPGAQIPGRFPRVTDAMLRTNWLLDEVIVALLLARVSDPRVHYKIEALRGVVDVLRRRPKAMQRPLRWWLTLPVPRTSLALVLIALVKAEAAPYEVSRAISDDLQALCASSSWLVQRRARVLLERIGLLVATRGKPEEVVDSPPDAAGDWRSVGRVGKWRALHQIKDAFVVTIEDAKRRAYTMLPDMRARQERLEILLGMRGDAYPATPVVLWETEALFCALDDALTYLMTGTTDDETLPDPKLLEEALLPDLAFHLGRAASRCPRPQWPRPTEVVNGVVDDLTTVGEDDPAYTGWTRLAVIERECPTPVGSHADARPDRDITVWAAVVAWPYARDIPEGAIPFISCGEVPDQYGPIVAFGREGSWLGDPWRLEPPVSLVWTCGLMPSEIGEPLSWRDKDGEVAVAVRTWRVLRGDPEAEPASLEGCDLIVRPDMLCELENLHGELRELRITDTQPVPAMPK